MHTLDCRKHTLDCKKHINSTHHKCDEKPRDLSLHPRETWVSFGYGCSKHDSTPNPYSKGKQLLATVKDFYGVTSRAWSFKGEVRQCVEFVAHIKSQEGLGMDIPLNLLILFI